MSSPHRVGDFVFIHGLKKAPVYNGIIGIIVSGLKDERYGVQLLDHAQEWNEDYPDPKLSVGGSVLAVKDVNLKKSGDSEHWKIDPLGTSLLEQIVKNPVFGAIDQCDTFAEVIWNTFFETIPAMPLTVDDGFKMRESVKEAKGHKLFWFSMDAIQHHVIVEKCRGRYRLFQAHVDEVSAKQWCQIMGHPTLSESEVHKMFGGGRTVGDKELDVLFDLIKSFQQLTQSLIPTLLKKVDGVDQSSVKYLQMDARTLAQHEVGKAEEVLGVAITWSHAIRSSMGSLGLTTLDVSYDGEVGYGVEEVTILQRGRIVFEVPKDQYIETRNMYKKISGQKYLTPAVFVFMANTGIWWEHKRDPVTGGAVGYGLRMAALDVQLSEEEGVRQAKAKSKHVKETLGTA